MRQTLIIITLTFGLIFFRNICAAESLNFITTIDPEEYFGKRNQEVLSQLKSLGPALSVVENTDAVLHATGEMVLITSDGSFAQGFAMAFYCKFDMRGLYSITHSFFSRNLDKHRHPRCFTSL